MSSQQHKVTPASDTRQEERVLAAANAAWSVGDFSAVRRACAQVLTEHDLPAHFHSYAQLRIAQAYLAESKAAEAKATYEQITANSEYPYIHRYEAEECRKELERVARGLPPRYPDASRTRIAPIKPAREFYVAPDGRDDSPGTAAQPFATLARARTAVRALKADGLPTGAVAITLKSGEYPVSETLALTAEDSGATGAPVVYRAEHKGCAILYGGRRLTGFTPVTDAALLARLPAEARGKVYQCDLKSLGITDYGALRVRGHGLPPSPPTLELYCNGHPQTLARWPDEGFVAAKRLVAPGDKATGQPSVIEYDGDRPERWTKAEDPWLFGYFRYLWADGTVKIAAIDTTAKTLSTAEVYRDGMDPSQGIIYYAFNLLEEIDHPGEWYLDRSKGMLYFWPPTDPAAATIEVGMLSGPMLTLEHAAHVRIEGLVFDLARYNGIVVKDSDHCLIAGCTVTRFAGNGVSIIGGKANGIYGCDIHTIGRRATEVMGGDRATLTPAGHFVENCHLHTFGRIDRTYTPAIHLEGVGNRVAHNLMHDCPSSVMRIEGNDHLIEYNDVYNAVQESDDQGAMELYANPTYRGVVFRYNRFRDNGKTGSEGQVCGQAAIRFDDAISGMLVYGNLFIRSANGLFGAIQINSGRDNIIDNNIFADCRRGVSGGWRAGNSVWSWVRTGKAPADFYTDDRYLARYPAIAWMMNEPGVNHLWRNVFYNCGSEFVAEPERLELLANGVFRNVDPGFVDAAAGDFALVPDAALFETIGFKPIPLEEIGLYDDDWRATWPVDAAPLELSDWRICQRPDIRGDAQLVTTWQVFAPLTKDFPLPTENQLQRVPERLAADGRSLIPVAVETPNGQADLAEILGGTAAEKTAWIYIPLQTKKGGENTFGFGADWWLQAWIDGALVCDTTTMGNGASPPSAADHLTTIRLAPGAHLLVVRFLSGSGSSFFAAAGPALLAETWEQSHWWAR